jgi:hypothetical protein
MVTIGSAISKKLRISIMTLGVVLAVTVAPATAASARVTPPKRSVVSPDVTVTWQYSTPTARCNVCGYYLEIHLSGTGDGNWADIYPGNGTNTQKWDSISLGNGQYAFKNVNSGKCLEDRGYEITGNVDQWTCGSYGSNARWLENYNSDLNAYALQNVGNPEGLAACLGSSNWVVFGAIGSGSCFWY